MPDLRAVGLHLAFQFSYVRREGQREGGTDGRTFVSLDQMLVPRHSLNNGRKDKGTEGQRDKGTMEQRDKGTKGQREKGTKDNGTKGQKKQRANKGT